MQGETDTGEAGGKGGPGKTAVYDAECTLEGEKGKIFES